MVNYTSQERTLAVPDRLQKAGHCCAQGKLEVGRRCYCSVYEHATHAEPRPSAAFENLTNCKITLSQLRQLANFNVRLLRIDWFDVTPS
jgi:hypothetical protein